MTEMTTNVSEAIIAVCVFIDAARNWENYDALTQPEESSIEELSDWLGEKEKKLSSEVDCDLFMKRVYRSLKTDWTIGTSLIINLLQRLTSEETVLTRSYIDECPNPALLSLPGVKRAIEVLDKELSV